MNEAQRHLVARAVATKVPKSRLPYSGSYGRVLERTAGMERHLAENFVINGAPTNHLPIGKLRYGIGREILQKKNNSDPIGTQTSDYIRDKGTAVELGRVYYHFALWII